MRRFEAAAVIVRMEAAPGPSFNGSWLKRRPAQERFWRLGGTKGELGGGRGQARTAVMARMRPMIRSGCVVQFRQY